MHLDVGPRKMRTAYLSLVLAAALMLGCTRPTSTSAPEASATATAETPVATGTPSSSTRPTQSTVTPSGSPSPTYVEVATGATSTTPPSVEFPKQASLGAQREADKALLPSGAVRGTADPSGRYLAYIAPNSGQWQGTVRDTSTGKEWKVDAVAVCQCDGATVEPGPVWSSSGRFVAFGTGNWNEATERHVVVIEPTADRVTELSKPAWMRSNRLDAAASWRPGYDTLVVGQVDGVFMYDAAARTSTMMAAGTWPRFIGRDLVQYDLFGGSAAFYDIWRGGEVTRLPIEPWPPTPAINYENGRLAFAVPTRTPTCLGILVAHPALAAPTICIPGANAPAWSPDGRVLAFSRVDGPSSRSVVLFDPATSDQRTVVDRLPASSDGDQYLTTWSTDGRHLRLERGYVATGG